MAIHGTAQLSAAIRTRVQRTYRVPRPQVGDPIAIRKHLEFIQLAQSTPEWVTKFHGTARHSSDVFQDFWRSIPRASQPGIISIPRRKTQKIREKLVPHIEAFLPMWKQRASNQGRTLEWIVEASADPRVNPQTTIPQIEHWLGGLPSVALHYLNTGGATQILTRSTLLGAPFISAQGLSEHMEAHAHRVLANKVRASDIWQDPATFSLDTIGPMLTRLRLPSHQNEAQIFRELDGYAFDIALASYAEQFQDLTAQRETVMEALLGNVVERARAQAALAIRQFDDLPLAEAHRLAHADATTIAARLLPTPLLEAQVIPPIDTPAAAPGVTRTRRFGLDASYVDKMRAKIHDTPFQQAVTLLFQELPYRHGDAPWMQQMQIETLQHIADGLYSVKGAGLGDARRIIYYANTSNQYIYVRYVGTHEGYNRIVGPRGQNALRQWVRERTGR